MKQTENYFLNKPELTDAPPDITVLNKNWDTIDKELKNLNDKTNNLDYLALEGGVMTGDIQMNDAQIKQVDDTGRIEIHGGTEFADGCSLYLMGKNNAISKGGFQIITHNGENTKSLVGTPTGNLSWNGEQVVTSAGATMNGDLVMNTGYIKRVDNAGRLEIYGGTDFAKGCSLYLMGSESRISKGGFQLITHNGSQTSTLIGLPDGSLAWNGKSLVAGLNPIGSLLISALNVEYDGYILCNGAAIDRDLYYELFDLIGTTYGAGDGSTTFNLPNYTNRFIMGNTTAGTVKEAGLPNIKGTAGWKSGSSVSGAFYHGTSTSGVFNNNNNTSSTIMSFDASKSNSIYGASTTVQPPAVTARIYIKY